MIKLVRRLKKEVAALRAEMDALKLGADITCDLAQTNVSAPGNTSAVLIIEGPRTGRWIFDGKKVQVVLSNPNAH